jgi:DNA mismatch repair ATPase MutS
MVKIRKYGQYYILVLFFYKRIERWFMSKLEKNYLKLKEKDNKKVYIFKIGIFYSFLGEDAIEMSKLLNLKLVPLNENIKKCGFPKNALNKYIDILCEKKINFLIVDNKKIDFIEDKRVIDFLDNIKNIDINNTNGLEALKLLHELKDML